MTILAAEAAGGAGAGGGAAAGGAAAGAGMPQAGQAAADAREQHRGGLLALGILLLWLAGVCFFFAFEGIQTEGATTTGGGLLKALITGLSSKAQAAENSSGGT